MPETKKKKKDVCIYFFHITETIQKLKQLLLKKLQYLKNKNNKKYTYKKMLLRRKCHVY